MLLVVVEVNRDNGRLKAVGGVLLFMGIMKEEIGRKPTIIISAKMMVRYNESRTELLCKMPCEG